MSDQFRCEHGHAYYDGDQGIGWPYGDGYHDAFARHGHADVVDWEPWERDAYKDGYRAGGYRMATVQAADAWDEGWQDGAGIRVDLGELEP